MKIIAYLCTDYIYFSRLLPELQRHMEVLPVILCETLHKLGKQATPEGLSGVWDYIMTQEKFDALWCYGLPDEVTLSQCRRYRIPVLIQEYWGHAPYNLTGILPRDCDWASHYAEQIAKSSLAAGRRNAQPVITLCLSDGLYDRKMTLGEVMKTYQSGGKSPRNAFWFPNKIFNSFEGLTTRLIDICRREEQLADCRIRVRLHPRYPELFGTAAAYVNNLHDPRYQVDRSPVNESLEQTDIIVQVNSNYGFDGIRAGAEVISLGGFAFFDNPQLTSVVYSVEQLRDAIMDKVRLIRDCGRKQRPWVPHLIKSLEQELNHPCLEPYPPGRITEVIRLAAALPQLEGTSTRE